jgi:ubiquinone biosynthesis protein UbiJ
MTAADASGAFAAVLADALTDLANRGLGLDPATAARLAALEGRRLRLEAELPGPLGSQSVTLEIRDGGLHRPRHDDVPPNVIVRGRPPALLAWLGGVDAGAAGQIHIDGDSAVLAELRSALLGFRPDAEAPLAGLLGPDLARDLLGGAELAMATLRSALQGGTNAMRHSAGASLADHRQLDVLLDRLDDLRLRVDRLGARVAEQESRRKLP